MFRDEFKARYTTIPFAIYREHTAKCNDPIISHWHKEIELIGMTAGCADFYIDSEKLSAKAGDVIIIPPCTLHRVVTAENILTEYNCICFDISLLCDKELAKGLEDGMLQVNPIINGKEGYTEALCKYIEKACIACEKQENGWELESIGCMSLLFGILKNNSAFTKIIKNKKEHEFGKNVISYIAENYASALTSHTMADAFYMNNSYFCRLFKKVFGCCFTDYVLAYRIEKARLYLINTDTAVSQIACLTGFNSSSYFGKVFKEKYGVSPNVYRKAKEE